MSQEELMSYEELVSNANILSTFSPERLDLYFRSIEVLSDEQMNAYVEDTENSDYIPDGILNDDYSDYSDIFDNIENVPEEIEAIESYLITSEIKNRKCSLYNSRLF